MNPNAASKPRVTRAAFHVSALAIGLSLPAGPAAAQEALRINLSGHVAQRCWADSAEDQARGRRLTAGSAASVRCSEAEPLLRVQSRLLSSSASGLAVGRGEAARPATIDGRAVIEITVSPPA